MILGWYGTLWYTSIVTAVAGVVTYAVDQSVLSITLIALGAGSLALFAFWAEIQLAFSANSHIGRRLLLLFGEALVFSIAVAFSTNVIPSSAPTSVRIVVLIIGLQALALTIDSHPAAITKLTRWTILSTGHGAVLVGSVLALPFGPTTVNGSLLLYAVGVPTLLLHAFWIRTYRSLGAPKPQTDSQRWEAILLVTIILGVPSALLVSLTGLPGALVPNTAVATAGTAVAGSSAIVAFATLSAPETPPSITRLLESHLAAVGLHAFVALILVNTFRCTTATKNIKQLKHRWPFRWRSGTPIQPQSQRPAMTDDTDTAAAGWFAGVTAGDTEAASQAIRDGSAAEPAEWPRLAVAAGFVDSEADYYRKLHEATIQSTKQEARAREQADDKQLLHAVRAMDDATRTANELAERLSEWAGTLFDDVGTGVDAAGQLADREPATPVEARVISLAERVDGLATEADELKAFIERQAPEIAPNLSEMAGPVLAARLIALAGGLESLAKKPSGTVQVLGAEDALFAHLAGRGSSPKHGIIYTHEYVSGTRPEDRGSASRAFAGKLSIAARIDHYSGELKPEIHDELDERMSTIRARAEADADGEETQ